MPVSGDPETRIAKIASAQRGRISRGQLRAVGISQTTIDRWVARDRLIPQHRGVFAVGHAAPTHLGAETAALLAVREGGLLSHHSAADLWGIRPPRTGDGAIHVTVPGGPGGRPAAVRVHRSRLLNAPDLRVHRRLPVTSPARTLLDLAVLLTRRELERAFDQALILRLIEEHDVAELLARCGRHRGRRNLAWAAARGGTSFTRSEAEERFLALIRNSDLPVPLVNARAHGYEIDFLWPRHRLAAEIDGYAYHSTRSAFERDRRKDADLQAVGLATLHVTWRQLNDEPLAVVVRLARALQAPTDKASGALND